MMNLLASLFTHPLNLDDGTLWMAIPLSIAVAVVYKTIRTQSLKRLPMEALGASLYILVGMAGLMLVGWAFIAWVA